MSGAFNTSAMLNKLVILSHRRRLFKSTINPKCLMKSAPKIGRGTSAIQKRHLNERRNPKSKVRSLSPKVFIVDPFLLHTICMKKLLIYLNFLLE